MYQQNDASDYYKADPAFNAAMNYNNFEEKVKPKQEKSFYSNRTHGMQTQRRLLRLTNMEIY